MKILVVDDEKLARERLIRLLRDLETDLQIEEAANGKQALHSIQQQLPDIVLLDIRMPGMDGLEVARHINHLAHTPSVIFTTAYDEHALKAFERHAVDYLLKPIRKERLQTALKKASQLNQARMLDMQTDQSLSRQQISANMGGKLILVPVKTIRYFQADAKYVTVGHPGDPLLIEDTLKSLEAEFGERFLRIHRNALIAPQFVESLQRNSEGHYQVHMQGVEQTLEVSRRLVATVKKVLKAR